LYIFGPHQPLPQDIEETCSNYSEKSPPDRHQRHDFFRSLLKIAKGVDAVGRFAAPVAIAGDVIQVGSAYHRTVTRSVVTRSTRSPRPPEAGPVPRWAAKPVLR